jgi:hypothetical protein
MTMLLVITLNDFDNICDAKINNNSIPLLNLLKKIIKQTSVKAASKRRNRTALP